VRPIWWDKQRQRLRSEASIMPAFRWSEELEVEVGVHQSRQEWFSSN
jgi:hypothetical protein